MAFTQLLKHLLLQGAGNLSYNIVSGSSLQQLCSTVVEHFVKVLQVEVHEKTLCHALEMLSLWTVKFYNEVPKKLVDAFKVSICISGFCIQ